MRPLQKSDELPHNFAVGLLGNFSRARAGALAYLKKHAGPFPFLENGITAPSDRVKGLDDLENLPHIPDLRVGTKVKRAVVFYGAGNEEGRIAMLHRKFLSDA